MDTLTGAAVILIAAGVIERVIEGLKPMVAPVADGLGVPEQVNLFLYIAAGLGLVVAVTMRLNVFEVLGVPLPTETAMGVGMVLTGLLLGGGSNGLHWVLDMAAEIKSDLRTARA